jgi:hypothetical protein
MTESKSWDHLYVDHEKRFEEPIILEAEVTTGFKRGSTELGFISYISPFFFTTFYPPPSTYCIVFVF